MGPYFILRCIFYTLSYPFSPTAKHRSQKRRSSRNNDWSQIIFCCRPNSFLLLLHSHRWFSNPICFTESLKICLPHLLITDSILELFGSFLRNLISIFLAHVKLNKAMCMMNSNSEHKYHFGVLLLRAVPFH